MRPTALRIVATGGTFDKIYQPSTGTLGFADSHLPTLIERARMTVPTIVEVLFLLDSLDMKDADRHAVLDACLKAPESALVVIHGTDTMRETARLLGPAFDPALGRFGDSPAGPDAAERRPKTIVLTGAMIPYSVGKSDASFNLGFACACAQVLAPGVYAAMNGRVFAWDKFAKNRDAGVFEETE